MDDEVIKRKVFEQMKAAQRSLRECFLCGRPITGLARLITSGKFHQRALFTRFLVLCPTCVEQKPTEVDKLQGDTKFDIGFFNR